MSGRKFITFIFMDGLNFSLAHNDTAPPSTGDTQTSKIRTLISYKLQLHHIDIIMTMSSFCLVLGLV